MGTGGHSSPAAKMATHLQASKGGGAQWGKGAAAKPLELQPQPSPMEVPPFALCPLPFTLPLCSQGPPCPSHRPCC